MRRRRWPARSRSGPRTITRSPRDRFLVDVGDAGFLQCECLFDQKVPDALVLERARERLAAKVRVESALRVRTHVGDRGDGVLLQELKETGERMIGVADRQDDARRVVHG